MPNRNDKGIPGAILIVFHLASALQFAYAIYYDYSYVHITQDLRDAGKVVRSSTFGGKFKYLTFLDGVNSNLLCFILLKIF